MSLSAEHKAPAAAIFKYPLELKAVQEVVLPLGAILLDVQVQHEQICVWAVVEPSGGYVEKRVFHILPTGRPGPEAAHNTMGFFATVEHLGTVQMAAGALVWHIFVEKRA